MGSISKLSSVYGRKKKRTSIGNSKYSRPKSRHKRRDNKKYNSQGK